MNAWLRSLSPTEQVALLFLAVFGLLAAVSTFTLAQMFPEVVLVPAWIDNVQRVMPKGEVVPVPILCSVTFGAPIQLEEGEERRPFLDRAREAVIALREV